jgi:uncharacterized protein
MPPLTVNVAELLRRHGTRRELRATATAADLKVVDSGVPDGTPIDVDVVLESLADGIVVSGRVGTFWTGACRRCLEPVEGPLEVNVRELYQHHPKDTEAFTFQGELLDLEPMVREAVLLELPLAPLCRPDCAGLCPECGANRNLGDCGHHAVASDPRWAALAELLEPGRLDRPDA